MTGKPEDNEPPGHKLHRLTVERMDKTGEKNYQRAFFNMIREPENLVLVWAYQKSFEEPT